MKALLFFVLLATSFVHPQNTILKNTQNQFDYVIITNESFISTCEVFKSHKELYNNFSVLITTKNRILKEFSTHPEVQENIRNFISYAGRNYSEPRPSYFLIAADLDSIPNFSFTSVDFENYDDTSYSDYYYAVDTSEIDSSKISYAIGRVAARNNLELENYFNKVIKYESDNDMHSWNRKSLFVTDDYYGPDSNYVGDIFIKIAQSIADSLPDFINSKFIIPIDTSNFWGNTDSIIVNLNSGMSAVFFIGFSDNTLFTHDSLFTAIDVSKLQNDDKPFFISIMGEQQFSRGENTSMINEMILSSKGALASINSVGIHFVSAGNNFYNSIWQLLFSDLSIGEIYLSTMNSNIHSSEKRKYNIFGDPSVKLKTDFISEVDEITNNIPSEYTLYQNYPNPFNPTTIIKYSLPNVVDVNFSSHTKLMVNDILGKEVATLINEQQKPGNYQLHFNGENLASGIYYYQLRSGNFSKTKTMVLLK